VASSMRNWLRLPGRRQRRRAPGAVTALEVDGATLRVVTATNRGTITRAVTEKLELVAEADRADARALGAAVAAALERLRLKPGTVVMGVPRASVLLRTLSLPMPGDLEEVAAMVYLQLGKDLPFRLEEAVVDFKVRSSSVSPAAAGALATSPPAKIEVLVAVVKAEVVKFYQETAAAAGLKLAGLGLLSFGNARCAEACRIMAEGGGFAIVSLRPDEVGIDLVAQGSLLFSRGASLKGPEQALEIVPGVAATPREEIGGATGAGFVEAASIEVVRSLRSFGGLEANPTVAKVVVAGGTGQEEAVAQALQERLSLPCAVLDVVRALALPPETRSAVAGSIAAVGLALGVGDEGGLPFDFLHPKQPVAPRNLRQIRLVLGAAVALTAVVFVFGLRSHLISQRLKVKARVAQELAEATKKRPIYERMRRQVATVNGWTQGGHNWLEHYAYLSAVLPPCEEVYITSLSISGSGAIRLSVQARSGQVLAKLDKQLRAAGYVVGPLAINPGEDKHGYGFRSTVELEAPPKMHFDLGKLRPPRRPLDDVSLDGARKGGQP
jgi:Tfp pilus assembly PilM family ATPase